MVRRRVCGDGLAAGAPAAKAPSVPAVSLPTDRRTFILAFIGFTLFMTTLDFLVWGRAFSGRSGRAPFSVDEIRLFYSIPNIVSLGFTLLAAPLGGRLGTRLDAWPHGGRFASRRSPVHSDSGRHGVDVLRVCRWGGAVGMLGGIALLGALYAVNSGVPALLVTAALLSGMGLGLELLAWQAVFVLVDDASLMKIVLGSCVVFPIASIVAMRAPHSVEYVAMALAAAGSLALYGVVARRLGRVRHDDSPGEERIPTRAIATAWLPTILCLGSLGFVTGISRTLTLHAVSDSSTLVLESLACILAVALLLAVMWRVRGSAIAPVAFYQVAFPVVATGLVAFAVSSSDFTTLFAGLSYFFFELALVIAIVHNVQESHSRPGTSLVAYGLVTGSAYLLLGVGTLLGFVLQLCGADGRLPLFTIAVVVCIYALSLPLVFQARRHTSEGCSASEGTSCVQEPLADGVDGIAGRAIVTSAEDTGKGAADFRDAIDHQVRLLTDRYGLTPRESQILGLVLTGYDSPAIAERLSLSDNTVRSHKKNLYRKLDVHSKQDLIAMIETPEKPDASEKLQFNGLIGL